MKTKLIYGQRGSVLMISLLTITILTMICATSLYIMSQNGNATTQTTSWQQALSGAEAAVDQAMNALNTSSWSGWYVVTSSSLPASQPNPSGTPNATSTPGTGKYNYLGPSAIPGPTPVYTPISLSGEASNSITWWVTVDNGSVAPTPSPSPGLVNNGKQAYRIRATGLVAAPGPPRVSNQKLDNDLRKISLKFDRLAGGTISTPQAVRRIEMIATPVISSMWTRGILAEHSINMSGSAYTDSFDSTNAFKSTNGLYDSAKRQSHGDIATLNSWDSNPTNQDSDLRGMNVYGSLSYNGPAVRNTNNVKGTISTPFAMPTPAVPSDPTWSAGSYTTQSINSTMTISAGTRSHPALIKTSGDLNLSGSNVLTLTAPNSGTDNNYIVIWVTGQFQVSGSAQIVQQQGVNVTFYVDNQINLSGQTIVNGNSDASTLTINGTWDPAAHGGNTQNAVFSGSQAFIGLVNAPGYAFDISGSASYSGAFIGNKFNISGGAAVHYDEHLGGGSGGSSGSYTFSSWFEDNSDPSRGITY
jgi:hypothetical protein